jgi:pantoate--beta-alanine ligase
MTTSAEAIEVHRSRTRRRPTRQYVWVMETRVRVVANKAEMQEIAESWRQARHRVGLVPTMGALHEGHLSLVRGAREQCDRVAVSIFVNPLQFGPAEDFADYPRDPDRDLELLGREGVDAAYLPGLEDMYPPGATTRVRVHELDQRLEGAHRPGHFEGVATVVTKLFNAARPHRAYFGQKDAQQAALISRMARDLDTGVEIVILPTVRDSDGVALSSRNAYLSEEERHAARCLVGALRAANSAFLEGERDDARLRRRMVAVLAKEPLARPDYAEVVDPTTFESPGTLAVLAVRIGHTRLIDNHPLGEPLG